VVLKGGSYLAKQHTGTLSRVGKASAKRRVRV
jgi:hypothetical protein